MSGSTEITRTGEIKSTELLLLVRALHTLNADATIPENYDKYIKNSQIESLANSALIGYDGHCLWDNHEILKSEGFAVFPGEQDRYGWLTGCIQTKKGIICFG